MPHSRGGPHRLGGRAAPLRCRDAQASPRRIAEAAVLVPALGPGLCLRRPAPGIRHSAFGTRPPALTFDSAIRPPTLPPAPDSRSVDPAPISERWKIQLFRRSFFVPLPVPPPAAFMLCFCASPSAPARPFSPLLPPFLPVLHLLPCPCSTTPSACRLLPPRSPYRMSPRPFSHLVSPPRVAVVLRLRAAVVLRLRAVASGRFLSSLPRGIPSSPDEHSPIRHPSKGAQAVPFGACP